MTEIYIAPTRQGTINISAASTTITGNDSDFSSIDIGKQIKIRTREGYKSFLITAVSTAISLTIDAVAGYNQQNCYYNTDYKLLDVSSDIKMPLTYSVFDITEPGKRGGTRSKTLALPGTSQNNIIFNHIFEIDSDSTFNPNIKADCFVYQDTIEIFRGIFRLLQVNRTFESVTYECAIIGRVTNIYTAWGDKNLSDLNLSDFNHNYTQSVQANSWTLSSGYGYIYPLIDYGETDLSEQKIWQVNQLYPAVYVKALMDKIFALAGFTYNSAFFNSDLFNKLIIPFNAGSFKYGEHEVASRQFEAGIISATASVTTSTTDQYVTIPYDNTSTLPNFDTSGQFNTSTHKWTVAKTGHYNINLITNLQATFTNTTGFTFDVNYPAYIEFVIVRGGTPLPIDPSMRVDISPYLHYTTGVPPFMVSIPSVFQNQYLLQNDVVHFQVHLKASNTPLFSLHVDIEANSHVYNDVVNETIAEGDLVVMSDAIPQNIRIADFFSAITNMFNLYIDEDKDVPNQLNIEPRNDFYSAGTLQDWTSKWDKSQDVNITPMGELTSRNYLFTYRNDKDYWNDRYSKTFIQADHNENYGEYWLPVDNDFLTNTQTIDVIFAPTVLSQYKPGSLIIPSIRFIDANPAISTDHNTPKSSVIRILYYGGLKSGNWTYRNLVSGSPVDISETQYPYTGHFDDPVNPTLDINFGLPAELYYQTKGQAVTDNNLYNSYYSSQFDEITDKDSKVISMHIHLTPVDIQNLDFRNEIYIAGQYYRLLEITDFDLVSPGITKCQFLKLKTGRQFVAGTHSLNGGKGGTIGNQRVPLINYTKINNFPGIISGKNNTNKTGGVVVTGDLNTITGKNVQVFGGNNNTVNANNVTLINTNDQTITDDGLTFIDGEQYVKASNMSGKATLVAGAATITFTGITPTSIILITFTGTGTLAGTLSVAASTGSFAINSTSATDTAIVNWYISKI